MIRFLSRAIAKCRRRPSLRHFAQGRRRTTGETIELGGRVYRKMGASTLEHDWRFIALLRELDLLEPKLDAAEPAGEYGRRLLVELLATGRAGEVLAHLIMPAEFTAEQWTPEIAAETAVALAALTADADKETVHSLTLGFLLDFFETGLRALPASRISSTATAAPGPKPSPAPAAAATAGGAGRP